MTTVDYKTLMELGFKEHTARNIIREVKVRLVNEGYDFYANQRCGIVPAEAVEDVLGITIKVKED